MAIKDPFTNVDIKTADNGIYENNNVPIALISKSIMVALVIWALEFPANANTTLGSLNGSQESRIKHRIVRGVILSLVIGTLILAAGYNNPMGALRNAMIIGALPFTMVMGLMCLALAKAFYRDRMRDKHAAAATQAG